MTGGRKLARHDSGDLFAPVDRALLGGDMKAGTEANTDAMPNFISRRQFAIEWGHCDPAGIVFNARFFEFFDWGTWGLFESALGMTPQEWPAAYGVVGIPLVDSGARFITPARFGDVVELTSRVMAFRRSSFDVEHKLTVRGVAAVEGHETRVWAGRDPADPDKMKSKPIPPEVAARFRVA
ncbi:MAG TPA: thioesterase family protein [Xanthobacteraceae bacterium]|nr:thioesterase family protein [Xanthobacteraceae bacterium]